jgi:inhibitor of KinA
LIPSFSIFPLGDSAITLDLGNRIDEQLNRKALAVGKQLEKLPVQGILDIIVAYSTVSVFYDPAVLNAEFCGCGEGVYYNMRRRLVEAAQWILSGVGAGGAEEAGNRRDSQELPASPEDDSDTIIIKVPVCYGGEFGPDLDEVARTKQISAEELILLHSARIYRVYMIGFLPGFSYLGTIDQRLEVSRKDRPVPVTAGGVGIAGNQTGIYPLNSPGGWQIIGRTPLTLFDARATTPVLFSIGDQVQFYPVTELEFREWGGLPIP